MPGRPGHVLCCASERFYDNIVLYKRKMVIDIY